MVTSACWIWTGAVADDGYGRLWATPNTTAADGARGPVLSPARWTWQAHHGPIQAGLVVRHQCDQSLCVRPACLLLGAPADNAHDALRRDRLTIPGRTGKADRRGTHRAALALRTAVLRAVEAGVYEPAALAAVAARVQAAGDPYASQPELPSLPPGFSAQGRLF
ncbi:HNH endonuclease [Streptomyces sp. NPDC018045]|uniref:HNH endonuclease n=1 Tax=Streptomyces sp. NPDC018045 TaxID=3365037 RepID=UPI0037B69BC8